MVQIKPIVRILEDLKIAGLVQSQNRTRLVPNQFCSDFGRTYFCSNRQYYFGIRKWFQTGFVRISDIFLLKYVIFSNTKPVLFGLFRFRTLGPLGLFKIRTFYSFILRPNLQNPNMPITEPFFVRFSKPNIQILDVYCICKLNLKFFFFNSNCRF